jgi:uncharacterized membrane protein YtjA (UPF0391 family)
MLNLAVTLLIIALIAAVLGFGSIAVVSVQLAKIVFFVALLLFLIAAIYEPWEAASPCFEPEALCFLGFEQIIGADVARACIALHGPRRCPPANPRTFERQRR